MLESKQVPCERDTNRHLSPALPWDSRSSESFEASGKWVLRERRASC